MSRRLGVSLGVDLIPYKYCPLNCVYCEVQRTTHLSSERQEFFPIDEIIGELKDVLSDRPPLDYITFSGAGEPTLYSKIGQIVSFIKENYPEYKLALITNSILLTDPLVRNEVLACDISLPSLDAVSQDVFEKINRPHAGILAEDIVEGLIQFRQVFQGQIWLEVFIIPDVNDSDAELEKLAEAISKVNPDRVQINSLDRPGTEAWVKASPLKTLKRIKSYFESKLSMEIEIIAKVNYDRKTEHLDDEAVDQIQATLKRRPCTAEDLSHTLELHINEVSKILRQLHSEGLLRVTREARGVFYTWKS